MVKFWLRLISQMQLIVLTVPAVVHLIESNLNLQKQFKTSTGHQLKLERQVFQHQLVPPCQSQALSHLTLQVQKQNAIGTILIKKSKSRQRKISQKAMKHWMASSSKSMRGVMKPQKERWSRATRHLEELYFQPIGVKYQIKTMRARTDLRHQRDSNGPMRKNDVNFRCN